MVLNIGPVNEYEARSPIIPFVGIIIRKNMSCDNKCTSFLFVGVLRHRNKADFSRRQNVPTKIYVILSPYFVQNKCHSYKQIVPPPEDQESPPGGRAPQFDNL
jgi:hypothetical protein